MVSSMRYHSFKELDLRNKVPFMVVLILVLVIALINIAPAIILFLIFLTYAVSGPIVTLVKIRQHRSERHQPRS
jgi:CDP-diacylglycerol--serine O-phosphatidyltransferase